MPERAITPTPKTNAELRDAVISVVFKGRREIDRAWLFTYHETGRLINHRALASFRHEAKRRWHYWLSRRSRERYGSGRLWRLLTEHLWLPQARIVHTASPQQLAWSLQM